MEYIFLVACNNADKTSATKTDNDSLSNGKKEIENVPGIIGRWVPVEMNFQNLSEEEKIKIIGKASIEFESTGKFQSYAPNEKKQEGVYTFKDSILTTTTDSSGRRETFEVQLKGNRMYLKNEGGTMVMERQ